MPTLIGMNGTGKSSLIKALDFAMHFTDRKSYLNFLGKIKDVVLEDNKLQIDITSTKGFLAANELINSRLIKYFDDIVYAGSEKSKIIVNFFDGVDIEINIEGIHITIVFGGHNIDIRDDLYKLIIYDYVDWVENWYEEKRFYL